MNETLYVDDDTDLLGTVKAFLERTGEFKVTAVPSIAEAVEALAGSQFDLIISGLRGGETDGLQLLRMINATDQRKPFILFTVEGGAESIIEAHDLGASFVILKGGDPRSKLGELEQKARRAVEMKRTAESLRESERQLQTLVNKSPLAIAYMREGRFFYVNPAYVRLLGYGSMEELAGHRLDELIDPGYLHLMRERIERLKKGMEVAPTYESLMIKADGSRVSVLVSTTQFVRDNVEYTIAFLTDLTERKRVEDELRESQEDLAFAQTVSRTGSWRLNVHTDELLWSDEAYRIFGIPKGTPMTFGAFVERIHPEDRDYVTERWNAALAGGPYDIEHRIVVDGEVRWVRETAIMELEGNELQSGFGTVQDITDRKRVQEALQRSEQMLKIVLDHFPGVVFWKDRNSVYLGANRESARVAGFSDPSEYIGKTDYDMPWGKTEGEAYRADDRLVMESGQAKLHIVERQLRSDGRVGWLDTSKVPLRDHEGKVIGVLGTSTDITDQKHAEDALRQANKQLNLLNSVTRHDMLNQMMVLQGFSELLEASGLDHRQAELLKKIQTSIEVLRGQLEFTKVYQEIGAGSPKWQNLHALVQEGKQNLILGDLRVEEEGTNVWIMADPMLEKVVYNLMENVLRHSGGARLLCITAHIRDGRLTVVFEDDGRGIAEEDKKHLFEHGYGKNTGFGLFVSREILGITNMSIRETSAPGKGARFEIEVPQETMFRSDTSEER